MRCKPARGSSFSQRGAMAFQVKFQPPEDTADSTPTIIISTPRGTTATSSTSVRSDSRSTMLPVPASVAASKRKA